MRNCFHKTRFLALLLPLPLALLFFSFAGSAAPTTAPAERAHITIMATTDLHGNILPLDYYTNKRDGRGLALAATIIKQARRENPNLLLLDSGDTIQGTPLVYYHNKKNNAPPDPMMLAMSALKYDAMTVGNHEYNFGLKILGKARSEAKFPWLSANTYRKGTDETAYDPYIVREMGGVRVGILGLTTPGVPVWENPQNYEGLEFREPVSEAQKWVSVLRNKERVDLVIVAMHMGLEQDLRTGEKNPGQVPNENAAISIALQVPGIDLILMGHTHREVPSLILNVANNQLLFSLSQSTTADPDLTGKVRESLWLRDSVVLAQANYWGRHVARADFYLTKSDGGSWVVAAKAARTIPVDDRMEADAEITKLVEPYDRETQAWLGRAIGESAAELSAANARFRDTAILDLIQRVQLEAGRADVSMAASFNPEARIAKGAVTVRDIAGLYIYENTLVTLEVTGQQLKEALEYSAKYFRAYVPGKAASELVDEKIPGYNFDVAEGVTYDLDITKPFGQRIRNLSFKGRPLGPAQKLRLVTNNYRVNGGGGYTMYRDAPVVYRSSEEIRELIIDWVERHKQIPVEPTNNWRLLPE
ncbi:MAG TPA: 5'-nucleotidase C-terminal domain-containing protein [Pyrinomonadaceae bacterium]|jgi:2',3'-cyclic-nucleotide 2'-phosphodiesterase/3'-nucleotidase|nr:5'-nucleotidase C-terminal domain-containing protein [Pyrinomonadaceae bacterium]